LSPIPVAATVAHIDAHAEPELPLCLARVIGRTAHWPPPRQVAHCKRSLPRTPEGCARPVAASLMDGPGSAVSRAENRHHSAAMTLAQMATRLAPAWLRVMPHTRARQHPTQKPAFQRRHDGDAVCSGYLLAGRPSRTVAVRWGDRIAKARNDPVRGTGGLRGAGGQTPDSRNDPIRGAVMAARMAVGAALETQLDVATGQRMGGSTGQAIGSRGVVGDPERRAAAQTRDRRNDPIRGAGGQTPESRNDPIRGAVMGARMAVGAALEAQLDVPTGQRMGDSTGQAIGSRGVADAPERRVWRQRQDVRNDPLRGIGGYAAPGAKLRIGATTLYAAARWRLGWR